MAKDIEEQIQQDQIKKDKLIEEVIHFLFPGENQPITHETISAALTLL